MAARTLSGRREHGNTERVQKENEDTGARRLAGVFVGGQKSPNQMTSVFSINSAARASAEGANLGLKSGQVWQSSVS